MTDKERAGSCPHCGHSILNHRVGRCWVDVGKGYCDCREIQPPNSQGQQLRLHDSH